MRVASLPPPQGPVGASNPTPVYSGSFEPHPLLVGGQDWPGGWDAAKSAWADERKPRWDAARPARADERKPQWDTARPANADEHPGPGLGGGARPSRLARTRALAPWKREGRDQAGQHRREPWSLGRENRGATKPACAAESPGPCKEEERGTTKPDRTDESPWPREMVRDATKPACAAESPGP